MGDFLWDAIKSLHCMLHVKLRFEAALARRYSCTSVQSTRIMSRSLFTSMLRVFHTIQNNQNETKIYIHFKNLLRSYFCKVNKKLQALKNLIDSQKLGQEVSTVVLRLHMCPGAMQRAEVFLVQCSAKGHNSRTMISHSPTNVRTILNEKVRRLSICEQ